MILSSLNSWISYFMRDRVVAIVLTLGAVVAGTITFFALRNADFLDFSSNSIFSLFVLDFVLLFLLSVIIARKLVKLWSEQKEGLAGSGLHVHLTVLFGAMTAGPAILVIVFSAVFFHFGIEAWFNERVKTAINESLTVAEAYLKEHQKTIAADVALMAHDLSQDLSQLIKDPVEFDKYLTLMASLRSLREAVVFEDDAEHTVLARSKFTFLLELEPLTSQTLEAAKNNQTPILIGEKNDRVRALMRIDSPIIGRGPFYLYVGRFVDPEVLSHVLTAEGAAHKYTDLESHQREIHITFILVFSAITFVLLLVAVLFALILATQLVRPIRQLIEAARSIGAGNLTTRIVQNEATSKKKGADGEIGALNNAFNLMAGQLELQQAELKDAARQIETRRQFIESVLSGVSAGVIGLDAMGRINLPNKSASKLLRVDLLKKIGEDILVVFPEVQVLFEKAQQNQELASFESQVNISKDGYTRTLLIRLTQEKNKKGEVKGFVLTFDDMTEQLSDQRKAAWADVAKRIAHEIKNPLTPIQLSAERLRRKYLTQVTEESEGFVRCVDTIMRQVETIGALVTEFSSFARMPIPKIKREDLSLLCGQAVELQKNAHPNIAYVQELPKKPVFLDCDATQIMQTLTNLLQNAADAIEEREVSPGQKSPKQKDQIILSLARSTGKIQLEILDTGSGLPEAGRERLMEPYYTTRKRGSGLGLAIVQKIIQDHRGTMSLEDRGDVQGARVTLSFTVND